MPLPPKGDPRRPLHLAIRSTRLLAIIFLFLGGCVCTAFLRGRRSTVISLPALAALLFYFGPGVAYLIFSIYLKRRQFWAVLSSLILASIQLLFTLAVAVSLLIVSMIKSANSVNFVIAPLIVLGIVILALAQLVYHLALSFEAIKHVPVEEQRGFEPLMFQPIIPSQPADQTTIRHE